MENVTMIVLLRCGISPPAPVAAQIGVEHVIAPSPANLEVALGHPFILETALLEQSARSRVLRKAGCLQTAEIKRLERMMGHRRDGFSHITLARVGDTDPVPQGRGLGRTPPDIVNRDRTQKALLPPLEEK